MNNPDWDNNEPGTDTRFAFAELAFQAMLAGELEVTRDSCGRIFVIPSKIFAFALAQGLEMESSLRVVWLEALNEPASADTAPATVSDAREIHEGPAHPSEIQMTTKEPEKKIRAEWWISTDDGSLFFRTFTNEIEDGVAEFRRGTKIQLTMMLLCERGHNGISIPEILEAAYPNDLEKLKAILRDAPRECTKDALLDYYKNAGVQKILKRAKQINRTLQKKLHTNRIPGEVVEILPGLETSILENPSAPVVFLRVQRLEKKRVSGFKISPRIVRASGAGEYTEDPSRPHLL